MTSEDETGPSVLGSGIGTSLRNRRPFSRAHLRPNLSAIAGFLLAANLYLLPQIPKSPRILDVLAIVLAVSVVARLAAGRIPSRPLALAGLAAIAPVIWLVFGFLHGDMSAVYQTLRWLLALPLGLTLLGVLETGQRRERFAWGFLTGGALNVVVILGQSLGLDGYLQTVGLSASDGAFDIWVGSVRRLPGMHGHHNATASVISLVVPAVFYLYFQGRARIWIVLATLAGLAIALDLTSTRSPLIVSMITVLYAALIARKLRTVAAIGGVLAIVVTPLLVIVGPPGGWARWKDTDAVMSNFSERLGSNWGALELIFLHPFGTGVQNGRELLTDATGIISTHNAFLQVGLFFGAAFGLLVGIGLLGALLRGVRHPHGSSSLLGLLSCQTAGLFMFEEHLNNPTFVILSVWSIVALGRSSFSAPKNPAPVQK